jgi:large subunit ribosomal protein L7/L12
MAALSSMVSVQDSRVANRSNLNASTARYMHVVRQQPFRPFKVAAVRIRQWHATTLCATTTSEVKEPALDAVDSTSSETVSLEAAPENASSSSSDTTVSGDSAESLSAVVPDTTLPDAAVSAESTTETTAAIPKEKGGGDTAASKKKALKEKYLREQQAAKEQAAAAEATDASTTTKESGDEDAAAARKKTLKEKAALKSKTTATQGGDASTLDAAPLTPSDARAVASTDAAKAPSLTGGPPIVDGVKQYSTDELTRDAARHKAGLDDPTRPDWQNPLHDGNVEMSKMFVEDFESPQAFAAAQNPAPPLDDGSGRVVAPEYLHDLADEMVHLTMFEMNELINRMADHYGFTEGMFTPDSGSDNGGGGGDDDDAGAAAAAAPEKTTFDVKLVSYDASIKIKIIKEVRVIVPGLGLKEAKELVEGVPVALQKGVSKEMAEQIKAKLDELGAVTEIV